jgi:DNA replicative helicase MCM subunit Mcm2 (Cdc46/Mcm family)
MVKVKVVPVEQEVPVDIPSDVVEPDVKEELPSEPSEPEVKQEIKTEELAIEAPIVEETKPKPKKEQATITCENCGKSMLMKTHKYSHMKLCKPAVSEPPPPPPTPEPKAKARAKREPKPKVEKPTPVKPEFNGEVSFTVFKEMPSPPHIEVYRQAREQRQQVRVQRVENLISEAL